MEHRWGRVFFVVPVLGLLTLGFAGTAPLAAHATAGPQLNKIQRRLYVGVGEQAPGQEAGNQPRSAHANTYFPTSDDGCPVNLGNNVKVNQNCLNISDSDLQGRGQAQNETSISVNPNNSQDLVATYNDYRRGDGTCGTSFSRDGGQSWTDSTLPNGFVRGGPYGDVAREYFQASGDPSTAWDTKGNAYFDCMMFDRGQPTSNNPDESSGIFLFRSTHNDGASWNFPGRAVATEYTTSNSGLPLLDKPYMTIDDHANSPYKDRIYVTWTLFGTDGSARIYEAHSSDYGETFSAPVLVTQTSTLCPFGATGANQCDENTFSDPFTAPDGTLYVVYQNFNNSTSGLHGDQDLAPPSGNGQVHAQAQATSAPGEVENYNNILISKSTDGGNSFGPPTLVSRFYDLPDCATYQNGQDFGRACVPEKGSNQNSVFRAENYPSGAVNPYNSKQVAVTLGSYINRYSNESNGCIPTGFNPDDGANLYTGVKTPGACNNKILLSVSNDAGVTFTGQTTDPRNMPTVNSPAQAGTDQFWQWASFSSDGQFAVSYYDRQYGNDETTGAMDISLSGSSDLWNFRVTRVTSSSMPLPTEFNDSQGNSLFFGDYSGLTTAGHAAFPLWSDNRSHDLFICPGTATAGNPPEICTMQEPSGLPAVDEDIYTATVPIPGQGDRD
jgi:hypothetical protein